MMKIEKEKNVRVFLVDDGTLDTVIRVKDDNGSRFEDIRFDCEYASEYRNKDGVLTQSGFKVLAQEAIEAFFENLD